MALISCHECGHKVSTEAVSCPSCGAKPRQPEPAKPQEVSGFKKIAGIVAVGALLIGGLWGYVNQPPTTDKYQRQSNGADTTPAAVPKAVKESAEAEKERLLQEVKRDKEAATFATVGVYVQALKDSMRDPPSFVLEKVLTNQGANTICIQYRAKNGMGGYNRESVIYHRSQTSRNNPADWDRFCRGSDMEDMTYIERVIR